MHIRREVGSTIDAMLMQGKVALIIGARQTGKTTVLKEHLGGSFSYVSVGNSHDYPLTKQDAVLFFDSHEFLLIVDEVQRVPELFSPVKWIVDQSDQKGHIVFTESQTYHLMRGVSEPLVDKIRIIEMPLLSLREPIDSANSPHSYVPARITEPKHVKGPDAWSVIHKDPMPELQNSSVEWNSFYLDYVFAHLERGVRDFINIQDEVKFYSFMIACATRPGQLLDVTDIGNAIGVDHETVKARFSVLRASDIVKAIQLPWPNVNKCLFKTPRAFFIDTELVCHFTRWTTPEQLHSGAIAGYVFETFVVSEVLKSYMNVGTNLRDVWFYRDAKRCKVDLVIQDGYVLYSVEVKTVAIAGSDAAKDFSRLDRLSGYGVGFRHVVCQTDEPYLVMHDVQTISVWEP